MRLSYGMNAFVEGKSRMLIDDRIFKLGLAPKPRASSDGRADVRSRSLMGRSGRDSVTLTAQRSVGKQTFSVNHREAL